MKRRSGSGRLGCGAVWTEDEINPLDGVANLADVMLVFACGLMLALITYWNVDVAGIVGNSTNVEQGQEVTEMEGLDGSGQNPVDDDERYEEYGTVYRDPETGKLYMVTTNGE